MYDLQLYITGHVILFILSGGSRDPISENWSFLGKERFFIEFQAPKVGKIRQSRHKIAKILQNIVQVAKNCQK